MNDPLKTFLERAEKGGWDAAQTWKRSYRQYQYPGHMTIVAVVFNLEAARAVWGEEPTHARILGTTVMWRRKQQNILGHIQNGDTPLEALSKEL